MAFAYSLSYQNEYPFLKYSKDKFCPLARKPVSKKVIKTIFLILLTIVIARLIPANLLKLYPSILNDSKYNLKRL